jgi:hypothetical protein
MVGLNFIPGRRPGEDVVAHFWRHPIIFFGIFLMFAFLFLVPIGSYFIIDNFLPSLLRGSISSPLLTVLFFSYYLFMIIFSLNVWVDNYLDVWTLTTMRIISRNQLGWFNRTNSELELSKVQDVTVDQKGILPTIFNYGNLHVQTAGATERFLLKNVPNPVKVSRIIHRLHE